MASLMLQTAQHTLGYPNLCRNMPELIAAMACSDMPNSLGLRWMPGCVGLRHGQRETVQLEGYPPAGSVQALRYTCTRQLSCPGTVGAVRLKPSRLHVAPSDQDMFN
eukprot:4585683-Amphidinium_carterae.1